MAQVYINMLASALSPGGPDLTAKKIWSSTSGCEVPALEVCVIPLLKKLKAMGHQKPSVGQIMDLQGLVKVQSVAESRSSQDSPRHL